MDWEYWAIDGRTASVKIIAWTGKERPETFYFEYWDDAWKFYLGHSRYHNERGIRYRYDFYRKFGSWFCCESH